jgi:hypothetical protein
MYPPAEAVTVLVIWLMDIRVLKAVARLWFPTDSEIRAFLAGFPVIQRAEKPIRNAKARRKENSPETIKAAIARSLHDWETRMTGFRPNLSDRAPQAISPAALLRLRTLWMTPRSTTLTPVERMKGCQTTKNIPNPRPEARV